MSRRLKVWVATFAEDYNDTVGVVGVSRTEEGAKRLAVSRAHPSDEKRQGKALLEMADGTYYWAGFHYEVEEHEVMP